MLVEIFIQTDLKKTKNTRQKKKSIFYTKFIELSSRSRRIIVRLECADKNSIKIDQFSVVVVDEDDDDSLTELVINDAKPIAGKAKLNEGFEGECC